MNQQTKKKTGCTAKYFQYKQHWDKMELKEVKDRKAIRKEIQEKMAHQPQPPKPRRVDVPNTSIIPTEKKCDGGVRPKPQSSIRPAMNQQTIKKTDRAATYFQYKQHWDKMELKEVKDRKAIRKEIQEKMAHQPQPPKPRRVNVPNTSIIPTEKKCDGGVRPKPQSSIRPAMNQQTIKKTDRAATYFQYKQHWDKMELKEVKDRKAIRKEIQEKMAYQPQPPKPHKVIVPNNYIVPTDKKRFALRMKIKTDLANGRLPHSRRF